MSFDVNEVPDSLRAERRWVGWRLEPRPGKKPTKVPYVAGNGAFASTTDPKTWGTFDAAVEGVAAGKHDGVGYVLGDGRVGIDLDAAIATDGSIRAWAIDFLRHAEDLGVYAERSVSGTGLHFIGRGRCPSGGHNVRTGQGEGVEWYADGRYFTVSADVVGQGDPDADMQPLIDRLERELFATVDGVRIDPEEIAARLRSQELLVEAAKARGVEQAVADFRRRAGTEMTEAWNREACEGYSEERQSLITRIAMNTGADAVMTAAVFSHSPRFAAECRRGKMPRLLGHEVGKAVSLAKARMDKQEPPPDGWLDDVLAWRAPVTLDAMLSPQPVRWLIEGWLEQRRAGLIVAEGGTGKTTVLLWLMVCIATGRDFFGLPVQRVGRSLLVSMDDPAEDLYAALGALVLAGGLSEAERRQVHERVLIVSLIGEADRLVEQRGQDYAEGTLASKLAAVVEGVPDLAFLALDTVRTVGGANSSDERAVNVLTGAMSRLTLAQDTVVAACHHTGKGVPRDDQYVGTGSSALGDNLRFVLRLTREEWGDVAKQINLAGPPAGDALKLASMRGSLRVRRPDAIYIARDGFRMARITGEVIGQEQRDARDLKRVVGVLTSGPGNLTKDALARALGGRKEDAVAVLERLAARGFLRIETRKPVEVTTAGTALARAA